MKSKTNMKNPTTEEREKIAKERGWTHVRPIAIGFSTEMKLLGYDPQKREHIAVNVEGATLYLVPSDLEDI